MKPRFVSVAAMLGIVGLASCSASLVGPGEDLAIARTKWNQNGPSSYTMKIFKSCECLEVMSGPVIVTVKNGVVTSRTYQRTGQAVPSNYAASFPGVEGLFDMIAQIKGEDPYKLDVRYDPALGYPLGISVDYNKQMVDDEISTAVFDFSILENI